MGAFALEIAVAVYALRLALRHSSPESTLRVSGVLLFVMALGAMAATIVRFTRRTPAE